MNKPTIIPKEIVDQAEGLRIAYMTDQRTHSMIYIRRRQQGLGFLERLALETHDVPCEIINSKIKNQ